MRYELHKYETNYQNGDNLLIILGGGTKKRQHRDIAPAKAYWQDYKARKH